MKMDYANNNCERRARELLAPLAGVCPDSVWDGISIDLEAKRAETNSKWLNKLSSAPKIPLIAAGIIIVITLSAWMIITH
ncbi:MAG TPA: hypothetical protein VNY36_04110, partial [Bacteroidia bacterium]|nr:hypothetical protein [Bacteroidia bacterium]